MNTRRDFMKTGGALVVGLTLGDTLLAQAPSAAGRAFARPEAARHLARDSRGQHRDHLHRFRRARTRRLHCPAAGGCRRARPGDEPGQKRSTRYQRHARIRAARTPAPPSIEVLHKSAPPPPRRGWRCFSSHRRALETPSIACRCRKAWSPSWATTLRRPRRGDRSVEYGELVGDKPFNLPVTGSAPVKTPANTSWSARQSRATTSPTRSAASIVYMQHVRVPGMLHGRVVRPRGQGAYGAGAKVSEPRRSSIRGIRGARVVRRGDFVGVVAENEWDAVRAAAAIEGHVGHQARASRQRPHARADASGANPGQDRAGEGQRRSRARHRTACRLSNRTRTVSRSRGLQPELRGRRRERRFRAGHLYDAGYLRHAREPGPRARNAGGKDSGAVPGRREQLRSRLPGRRRASGGDHVANCRQARSPAVHAMGRARLGQLRPGAPGRGARRRGRGRPHRRVRVSGVAAQLEQSSKPRRSSRGFPRPNAKAPRRSR